MSEPPFSPSEVATSPTAAREMSARAMRLWGAVGQCGAPVPGSGYGWWEKQWRAARCRRVGRAWHLCGGVSFVPRRCLEYHDQECQLLPKQPVRPMKRGFHTQKGGRKVISESGAGSLSVRSTHKEVADAGAHGHEAVLATAIQRTHIGC